MNMNNQTQEPTYFDVITKGCGYFNRVRVVNPKDHGGRGNSYLSLNIAALQGESNDVEYIRYNANVVGKNAINIINKEIMPRLELSKEIAAKTGEDTEDVQIFASFSLGDVKPKLFTYERGDKKGETGIAMQGRLLSIGSLKIDGETIDLNAYKKDHQADDVNSEN